MSMYCIEASSQDAAPISRGTGQPAGLATGGAVWEGGVHIANNASAAMSHWRVRDRADSDALADREMLKAFSRAAPMVTIEEGPGLRVMDSGSDVPADQS